MTELKTLEDLEWKDNCLDKKKRVKIEELKTEAIKHLKSGKLAHKADYWIKHFFNITEEELKNDKKI